VQLNPVCNFLLLTFFEFFSTEKTINLRAALGFSYYALSHSYNGLIAEFKA